MRRRERLSGAYFKDWEVIPSVERDPARVSSPSLRYSNATSVVSSACGALSVTVKKSATGSNPLLVVAGRTGARMTAVVASPLSSATNGAALRVEGGVVRSIL